MVNVNVCAMEALTIEQTLKWYLDAGVDEVIGETPVDRYAVSAEAAKARAQAVAPSPTPTSSSPTDRQPSRTGSAPPPTPEATKSAHAVAAAAQDLGQLRAALEKFDGCPLKKNATHLVFGAGAEKARIVFIDEAPGAEEDMQGQPFIGASGQLLDKMLASIGLSRAEVYVSYSVFWRPPGNRTPTAAEVSVCAPFLERMMELINPDILVTMGGTAAAALLGKTESVGRLRGKWFDYATPKLSRPVAGVVLYRPEYLLQSPGQKRNAWRDLLAIKHRLNDV